MFKIYLWMFAFAFPRRLSLWIKMAWIKSVSISLKYKNKVWSIGRVVCSQKQGRIHGHQLRTGGQGWKYAFSHFSTRAWRTDRPTDQPTDGRTDKASSRVAGPQLKSKSVTNRLTDRPTDRPTNGRMDKAGCRVACTRLKRHKREKERKKKRKTEKKRNKAEIRP